MQCPSCRADNATDARFCNMCGTRIATPDPSMGAIDAPNAMSMTGSVSLQGIGVQSSRRAYVLLGLAAGFFGVLGAFAMWAVMHSSSTPAPEASASPAAIPQGPVVIGDPIPRGLEPPPLPEAEARGARRGGGSGARATTPSEPSTRGAAATTGGTRSRGNTTGGTASGGTSPTHAAQGRTVSPGSSGAAAAPGAAGGAGTAEAAGGEVIDTQAVDTHNNLAGATGGGSGAAPVTGTTNAAGGGSGSTAEVPDDAPPEQDLAAELYGARVRRVIRQYYAARAQSCFEHASRNAEVRGTVVIEFTIASEGDVSRANVASNTTGNEALGRCLAAQVASWHLPGPGTEVDLSIPFSR